MNAEFKEWLDTVKYDNSNILSPQGLAWEAWQAASKQLTAVTEQRDRLAEALRKIKNEGGRFNDPYDELDFIDGITYEALQYLTQSPNNA
jgi:hypothetical protein